MPGAYDELNLVSREIGAHPVLQPFLERLRVRSFLEETLGPPDPRCKLPPVDTALLLLRNFTLSPHPLYAVPQWAQQLEPKLLDLQSNQVQLINDDRLGRTLDKLFKSDRKSMLTRLMLHMVQEFDIDLRHLHNDSTSLTFSGEYRSQSPRDPGHPPAKIVRGHNKDHRPDLKQLVWSLTVSHDGAVPVHYNVYDGNKTDDTTHIGIWDALCTLVGGPNFVYVADSKLCTRKNMAHIHDKGGQFITVLPRTRKEDRRFKAWLAQNNVDWKLLWDRPSPRRNGGPPTRFEMLEDPCPSSEGYRVVWYRSSEKWQHDERMREDKIQRARQEFQRLRERVGVRKLKTREQVEAAVERVFVETGARPWVRVQLESTQVKTHKQERPGRPGKDTRYLCEETEVVTPVVTLDRDAIRASATADGIFPLITNQPVDTMSALDVLSTYKYQAFVEKRHEQLKTAQHVVPVNFKTPERIEAYLLMYFLALSLHALIERHIRLAMKQRGIRTISLYPEDRPCRAPTADKVLRLFQPLRRHQLLQRGQPIKTFWDPLSDIQRTVLDLLGVPSAEYGQ